MLPAHSCGWRGEGVRAVAGCGADVAARRAGWATHHLAAVLEALQQDVRDQVQGWWTGGQLIHMIMTCAGGGPVHRIGRLSSSRVHRDIAQGSALRPVSAQRPTCVGRSAPRQSCATRSPPDPHVIKVKISMSSHRRPAKPSARLGSTALTIAAAHALEDRLLAAMPVETPGAARGADDTGGNAARVDRPTRSADCRRDAPRTRGTAGTRPRHARPVGSSPVILLSTVPSFAPPLLAVPIPSLPPFPVLSPVANLPRSTA